MFSQLLTINISWHLLRTQADVYAMATLGATFNRISVKARSRAGMPSPRASDGNP